MAIKKKSPRKKLIRGHLIKNNKSVETGIKQIYGLNKRTKNICKIIGLSVNAKIKDLTNIHIENINEYCKQQRLLTKKEITIKTTNKVKNLINMGTTKGLRIKKGFPIRGQRTHTNAKTAKKFKRQYGI